jgi:thioredoxin reductase (NADPH)
MQTDATLGEIFLKAFVLRRVHLISHSVGDAVLIGSSNSADTLHLRGFLTRNGHPHSYLDVQTDPTVQAILDQFGIPGTDIPVLICRRKLALRNPIDSEATACFGLNEVIDRDDVCDLIVVGAGPSGLAAAVYGSASGLGGNIAEAILASGVQPALPTSLSCRNQSSWRRRKSSR